MNKTLKGRDNACFDVVFRPYRACAIRVVKSQGVALGFLAEGPGAPGLSPFGRMTQPEASQTRTQPRWG